MLREARSIGILGAGRVGTALAAGRNVCVDTAVFGAACIVMARSDR